MQMRVDTESWAYRVPFRVSRGAESALDVVVVTLTDSQGHVGRGEAAGVDYDGETIPFLLWRFDSRAGPNFYAIKLGKPPSQYFKDNFVVTTSGMCSAEPLNCTIAALGHERMMFAADYPFESAQEAGEFLDHVPLAERVREDIAFNNAVRLLGLPRA